MKKLLPIIITTMSVSFYSCKRIDSKKAISITPEVTTSQLLNSISIDSNLSSEGTLYPGSLREKKLLLSQHNSDNSALLLAELDRSKLNTAERSWYYVPKNDGSPSGEPQDIIDLTKKYHSYYLGDISSKVLYLTFDEGYENGYTTKILDVLKKHNVKAAFFVVKPYVVSNKELVKRMVDEGHLVGNHSVNHPSMAGITDLNKFNYELSGVEKTFEETTGQKMPKYFRPPMGKYSELSLYNTAAYGYRSIFWSFAYDDWEPSKQPNPDYAKKLILQRTHNGAIILLHAVSKTNADILDELIAEWKARGFQFKTLEDLP